jgi:hypothetical protein
MIQITHRVTKSGYLFWFNWFGAVGWSCDLAVLRWLCNDEVCVL